MANASSSASSSGATGSYGSKGGSAAYSSRGNTLPGSYAGLFPGYGREGQSLSRSGYMFPLEGRSPQEYESALKQMVQQYQQSPMSQHMMQQYPSIQEQNMLALLNMYTSKEGNGSKLPDHIDRLKKAVESLQKVYNVSEGIAMQYLNDQQLLSNTGYKGNHSELLRNFYRQQKESDPKNAGAFTSLEKIAASYSKKE